MEALLKKQELNQIELEKFVTNLNKTPKVRRTEGHLTKKREMLDELWKECREVHREMLTLYDAQLHASHPYFKTDNFCELEELYCDAHGIIYDLLKPFRTAPTSSDGNAEKKNTSNEPIIIRSEPKNELPLPRINIPIFAGSYHSWTSFQDLFVSLIHTNKNLSTIQKFHYLQSCVTGEAKQIIRHLLITEANYEAAWRLLQKRYHNERLLVNTQLQMLMSIPSHSAESAANIKKLIDTSNECLESLKSLSVTIDNWDPLLIFILTQKLSKETITHWEYVLGNRENPNALPTIIEFNEFLESRFRTLDAINRTKTSKEISPKTSTNEFSTRAFVTNAPYNCPVCKRDHRLKQCNNFLTMSAKTRYELIKKLGRCLNCLSRSHGIKECPVETNCQQCGNRHNTLLHFGGTKEFNTHMKNSKQPNPISQNPAQKQIARQEYHKNSGTRPAFQYNSHFGPEPQYSNQEDPNAKSVANNSMTSLCTQNQFNYTEETTVLLATALVKVESVNSGTQILRILLDQGSQASFITEDAVQRLRLQKKPTYALVSGIGNTETGTSRSTVECVIQSCYQPTYKRLVEAFVLPKITGIIPTQKIQTPLTYLQGIQLADPSYVKPGRIDMLLGAEIYAEIIAEGLIKGPVGCPVAQNTILGWIVSGKISRQNQNSQETRNCKVSLVCNILDTSNLETALKRFWEIEEVPELKLTKPEDILCEEIYKKSFYRNSDGRYTVPLPFKDNSPPVLGDSRSVAFRRLLQVERKLAQDQQLYEDYKKFMKEYLSLGHMQKIDSNHKNNQSNEAEYFLPHHAVIKASSTTTKLRVVFDASCKTTNKKSLNDTLLPGPALQHDLSAIILRWRNHKIALSADIEKMYRQILIHPNNYQYQKIFWREDPNLPVDEYKLLTVTYGTSCAPYLAIRTLQQLAEDEKFNFPLASEILLNDFYVDDLITGSNSHEEAINIQENLRKLLETGGFRLRKWACNSEAVLSHIPIEDREIQDTRSMDFAGTIKTLGLHWNPVNDTFEFKLSLKDINSSITKRTILSEAARLYDPLGWISPSIIIAKIIFQKLWLAGVDWDSELPSKLEKEWKQFRKDLPYLENIKIPRWIGLSPTTSIEIHAFCDASMFAFAAVVYARCETSEGNIHTTLLAAKTKVAPVRQISIPRLELCGAVLLTKLVSHIRTSLKIENVKVYGWTDSLNVLAWIKGHPRQWHTFVANRVSQIQEKLPSDNWRYVRSADNPADCASRGISPQELKAHPLWWTGPSWLTTSKDKWPSNISPDIQTDLEAKRVALIHCEKKLDLDIINRFSHLNRLLRVTAYCIRYIHNLAKPNERMVDELTIQEINQARIRVEKLVQLLAFSQEISTLRNNEPISKHSRLKNLNPFLDNDGLLRVGGRLKNASIPYNQKYPVLLPEKSNFTELIIQDCHRLNSKVI